jgi:hypothetical protein
MHGGPGGGYCLDRSGDRIDSDLDQSIAAAANGVTQPHDRAVLRLRFRLIGSRAYYGNRLQARARAGVTESLPIKRDLPGCTGFRLNSAPALPTGALFLGLESADGLMTYPEQPADLCLALARLKAFLGFTDLILG